MISISKQNWEKLLNQLGDLIQTRISESQGLTMEFKNNRKLKPFNDLQTEFISADLGISLSKKEELICLIALLPFLVPGYFDKVVSRMFPEGAELPEFGGVKGINHRGFIPTGETALFLLAGFNLHDRMKVMQFFKTDSTLLKNNILQIEHLNNGEPLLSGKLTINSEILEKLFFDTPNRLQVSSEFPAKYISTKLNWDKLVIDKTASSEIETIRNWIAHHESMINTWDLKNSFKSGYKALFYGPPGTGKTFTAILLGKQFNKDVYRIDLSQVVSKYIGETEKNLEKVFQKAENKDWILFFDEADALFGKRTSISSSHDRYANQETAYLLQRIEDFNGLVILASNDKSNIDSAFLRRFNAIVHFPVPDTNERLHLWEIYLPSNHTLTKEEVLSISNKYDVTGSTILNAIHNSAINAYAAKRLISYDDIIESLKRELRKEDRMHA